MDDEEGGEGGVIRGGKGWKTGEERVLLDCTGGITSIEAGEAVFVNLLPSRWWWMWWRHCGLVRDGEEVTGKWDWMVEEGTRGGVV